MTEDSPEREEMDREIIAAFLDESEDALAEVDPHLVALENDPDDHEPVHSVFRTFHSIKGNAAFFGFMKAKALAHKLEDVLALMRDGRLKGTRRVMDALLCGVDQLRTMLARARAEQSEWPPEREEELAELLQRLTQLCEPGDHTSDRWLSVLKQVDEVMAATAGDVDVAQAIGNLRTDIFALVPSGLLGPEQGPAVGSSEPKSPAQPKPAAPAKPKGPDKQADKPADTHRTMRVEEGKIDQFLDYVGELIIVREMFANVGKRLRTDNLMTTLSAEYQRALSAFTALSHDLQFSIMEVRKVPVRAILQKLPRMVRDLAAAGHKEVAVDVQGLETPVDKSLLEGFEAPIMHMVRNAFDHGIEEPDVREVAGKSRCGKITISVVEGPDNIVFTITDDGGGIDDVALRNKAVREGMLTKGAADDLSREQAFSLLFAPGLSTAKTITEVSGRGVGMDVVKRNVVELGGEIFVQSAVGEGSTFRVHLPKAVTVKILDGFLVRVGTDRFVLPLQSINESFRPAANEIHSIAERGECITRRGRILPLVRFGEILQIGGVEVSPVDAIVVSIDVKGGGVAALLVDDVLGTQQVVLRDVDGLDTADAPFSGGAVLGDGRVAMVVDVDRLGALMA